MLVDWEPSLADNRPSHNLWQGTHPASGGRAQHYTNVSRVMHLALNHPLVDEVEGHKMSKAEGQGHSPSQQQCLSLWRAMACAASDALQKDALLHMLS